MPRTQVSLVVKGWKQIKGIVDQHWNRLANDNGNISNWRLTVSAAISNTDIQVGVCVCVAGGGGNCRGIVIIVCGGGLDAGVWFVSTQTLHIPSPDTWLMQGDFLDRDWFSIGGGSTIVGLLQTLRVTADYCVRYWQYYVL